MIDFKNIKVISKSGKKINFSLTDKNIIKLNENCIVKEIILFSDEHGFNPNTKFYGDGYQKLSQYGGTVANPVLVGGYTDKDHYKMPQTDGYFTAYNYVIFEESGSITLIGAASCNRFRTEFRINGKNLEIAQSAENLSFSAGDEIRLEDTVILNGKNKSELLREFGERIRKNHPMKETKEFPVGWCSWYCIGPNISERKIFKALKVIKEKAPEMKFIQIDDGFQPHMGDWLRVSRKFKHPMKKICNDIKDKGFEPAIWLAPFIASPKSKLFKEHPEYFVKDENGQPLCSNKVTFPGWRDAPWYMLDGTHPGAREYIYNVVKTIYEEWNVKYFKLDANNWGALPFGVRYDNTKTSVEAYRMMMETIFEASNNDAFILGCNAPMWPSLGLVSGMRITNDTFRDAPTFAHIAQECFYRNWMNNKLWLNDPDCLLIADAKPKIMNPAGKKAEAARKSKGEMYKLNAVYIRASGGSILSGDPVKAYGEKEVEVFKKLISLPKIAAEFDNNYEVGVIKYDNVTEYCIFNTSDSKKTYTVNIPENADVIDMYDNIKLTAVNGKLPVPLGVNEAAWIAVSSPSYFG